MQKSLGIEMKLLLVVMMLFSLLVYKDINAQQGTSKISENITKFDPLKNPQQDLKEAVTEARKSKKRIILDIGGEWCIWCHRIDDFINSNKDIYNLLHKNFVLVKVNYSPENKNEKFLSKYPKISGYPHFFVLNSNGKFVHSQDTGKLEKGKGYDKGKFTAFLKKWSSPNRSSKTL